MSEIVQVAAGELILDYSLYPRTAVNTLHVSDLANARRAGAEFPPVIVDRATMQVVDGFHRTSAVLRADGPEGLLSADLRDYTSGAEKFLDSVRYNVGHGLRLTQFDRIQILTTAKSLEIEESRIAGVLQVPAERLGRLESRKTGVDSSGGTVPLKGIAPHLHGKRVSPVQEAAMKRAGGFKITFYSNQVINALRGDLVNTESRAVIDGLWQLKAALDAFFEARLKESD